MFLYTYIYKNDNWYFVVDITPLIYQTTAYEQCHCFPWVLYEILYRWEVWFYYTMMYCILISSTVAYAIQKPS